MRFKHFSRVFSALMLTLGFAGATLAANHTVQVSSFTYTPQILTIGVNDTVTFTNVGGFHNVQSDPGAITTFRCANGCDGVGGGDGNASSALWSATVTFPTVGTVGYFCEIHGSAGQGMFGTIVVNIPVTLQSFDVE